MNKRIIHTVFENEVDRVPNNIAIEDGEKSISYRALNNNANQLAGLLRELGLKQESVVSVLLPSSLDLVTALLSTFKAGGVYLPIDIAFAKKRLTQILNQSSEDIFITNSGMRPLVEDLIKEFDIHLKYLIVLDSGDHFTVLDYTDEHIHEKQVSKSTYSTENLEVAIEPRGGNYIFYTSGSTGEGKAILGCHDSLSHFIHWEKKEFNIDEKSKVSQLAQITFDASLRDIFLPLATGGTLCIPSAEVKSNTARLIDWINASKITLIHCVPSLFKLLTKELAFFEDHSPKLPHLKHILMAGEPPYVRDVQRWRDAVGNHVELVNLYGTSETTLAKTFHRINEISQDPSQVLHVGKPISNTLIAILNDGQPCEIGEIGEVYIVTPFNTKGYYKDEALTNKVFVQNPLVKDRIDIVHKTGDHGRYLKDRNIEVLGRIDDQVKVNGIRVELGEIKQAVINLPGIQEAVVVAHKNNDNQSELICYFTSENVSVDQLIAHLKTELNENIVPTYFIQLPEFPLNINGKIDKKALPKPERIIVSDEDYEAPANELEVKLERIFMEVLGLKRIGRKMSFFKIGGTSLKAMQVISRIYKDLGVSVILADVFSNPTAQQLVGVVAVAERKSFDEIAKVPVQAYYEVTHAQKRLWYADQLAEERAAYNMYDAYRIKGPINLTAFKRAFQALIERHEILRTTFIAVDGMPKQKIHDAQTFGFDVEFADLSTLTYKEIRAREIADAEAVALFDLEQGPLLRARLLQLDDADFVFLLTMHHIISDGWSIEVMIDEVLKLYKAFNDGKDNPLSPLNIQYKDYAAWQLDLLEANKAKLEIYWLQNMSGNLPLLDFPTDFERPLVKTSNGDVFNFQLEESQEVQKLADENGATVFITLLAMVKVLLYKYTGNRDIIVGTPIAGRAHKELENQVGIYVNMLPLRTKLSKDENFASFLSKVKNTTIGSYEHQQYPFDLLISTLDLDTDRKRLPLIDVLVQSQNFVQNSHRTISGLTITNFEASHQTSKVDFTFNFVERNNAIEASIEYNTDLFELSTIEKIVANFRHIIQTAAMQPDLPLSGYSLMLSGEEAAEEDEFKKAMLSLE